MSIRYKKNKIEKGAPTPLFDRLIDTKPQIKSEAVVKNTLNEAKLRRSIAQELSNIFDSRIGDHIDIPEKSTSDLVLLPEQFGIRDFAALTSQSDKGKRAIASHLRAAILRFEPRLLNPKVRITESKQEKFDISVAISGDVLIDNIRKKIQFPVTLSNILQQK